MTGRTPGGLLMALSFQIESPSVGRGGPPTEIRKSACRVKRLVERAARTLELHPEADPPRGDVDLEVLDLQELKVFPFRSQKHVRQQRHFQAETSGIAPCEHALLARGLALRKIGGDRRDRRRW